MSSQTKKVVKSKTVLTAPNLKRFGAFLIDYINLYLILALIITLSRQFLSMDTASKGLQIAFYLFLIFVSLAYFIAIPLYVFKGDRIGQTPGKKILGLKTIRVDGSQVDLKTLTIRTLFELLGEGMVMISTLYVFEVFAQLGMPTSFANYITPAYLVVTFVSCIITVLRPNRQMFHDYIANTIVILYDQSANQ